MESQLAYVTETTDPIKARGARKLVAKKPATDRSKSVPATQGSVTTAGGKLSIQAGSASPAAESELEFVANLGSTVFGESRVLYAQTDERSGVVGTKVVKTSKAGVLPEGDAMTQFAKMLSINSGGRKKSTQDIIVNNIKRLYIRCYEMEPEDLTQIASMIKDISHLFKCIQAPIDGKQPSISTMLSYTNAVLVAIDVLGLAGGGGNVRVFYENLETDLQVRRADQERKAPPEPLKVTRELIDKINQDLGQKKPTKGNLKNAILFHILSTYPFRLETATLRKMAGSNVVVEIRKGQYQIDFGKYKTDTKYGKRVYTFSSYEGFGTLENEIVDKTLVDMLDQYYPMLDDGEPLFYKYNEAESEDKNYTKMRNNMAVAMKRLLKKYGVDASATDVTKLIITEIWDGDDNSMKLKFAAWRGHEVQTAAKVYASDRKVITTKEEIKQVTKAISD